MFNFILCSKIKSLILKLLFIQCFSLNSFLFFFFLHFKYSIAFFTFSFLYFNCLTHNINRSALLFMKFYRKVNYIKMLNFINSIEFLLCKNQQRFINKFLNYTFICSGNWMHIMLSLSKFIITDFYKSLNY